MIIATFNSYNKLLEAAKLKESWMPTYDEIENLERYKELDTEKILRFDNFRGKPNQIANGYRAFRFNVAKGYEYILTPGIGSSETNKIVNFKYGSYMIERDLPFSTESEMNLVIDTIFIYSLSMMGIARYDKLKRVIDSGDVNSAINAIYDYIIKYETFDNAKFYAISELLKLVLINKTGINLKSKTIGNILHMLDSDECIPELADILIDLLPDDILDDYISKNPTDIYYLDSMPDRKAGVLKRTGIKDLGKLGKLLKSGML
jgi:hypothetical protein